MTTAQRDRLTAAIQDYGFSARGHDWHVCVCATQEILGDRFLHLALVGEPLLTVTIQMPAGCNIRTAAAHIGDAIVDWLATADWGEHGLITLKLAS